MLAGADDYVAPRTNRVRHLQGVGRSAWHSAVGVTDNFFQQAGTRCCRGVTVLLAEISTQVASSLYGSLEYQTVESLAAFIGSKDSGCGAGRNVAALQAADVEAEEGYPVTAAEIVDGSACARESICS